MVFIFKRFSVILKMIIGHSEKEERKGMMEGGTDERINEQGIKYSPISFKSERMHC